MKLVLLFIIGLVAGIAGVFLAIRMLAPGMMLREIKSPMGFDETVEAITQNAQNAGWVVSSIQPLDESIRKNGGGDLKPIRLVNLCNAGHAFEILKEEDNLTLSVMMPCTISVYEKSDGNTYIGTMNAGLMGSLFGGTVARVMGGTVARQQQEFIAFAKH
ncbi:MAG TPA: DUF302 domain-containing protein [Thermoanaerobaculia bacterium]|nr:DUF302 domain-containing protein [Thermoanaerobaculia bacterium]HUM28868.1 DUF302 domain-containing protein [Thermoanaerobaculia bacterium]HXK67199.1 DUF302 domain-containing protein [Thermoanaerobaculia bacterium]